MKADPTLHARTKVFAKDHPWKSWWCIVSSTALLAAASAGTLPHWPLPARIVCSLLSGLLMVRLFVIYHDQQHRAILPKSRVAEVFMRVFGILILSPSSVWRSSHNHHHNHNSKLRGSHIGSFPIMTKAQYLKSSRGERFKYLFMRHPLTLLFGYMTVFFYSMSLQPAVSAPRRHWDAWPTVIIHLGLAALLVSYSGWLALVLTLIIPFFIAGALGAYLFYAQHNFPGVVLRDEEGWTYEGAALDSSSHLKMDPIMHWFTGNIGYHHVHHLSAKIPNYRLRAAHAEQPMFAPTPVVTLRSSIACFRLKLWDEDRGRLVPWPDRARRR